MRPRRAVAAGGRVGAFRSLTRAAFEAMRADILACRLEPGAKLPVASLAEKYRVNLSAVREGLSRLAAEGWVEAADQRGFRVSAVSVDDLRDLTQTRVEIDSIALRRSIERGDDAWITRVRAAHARMQHEYRPQPGRLRSHSAPWRNAHADFHYELISACGSARLLRFHRSLYEQSGRYRIVSAAVDTGARDVEAEHAALVASAAARDADAAVALLRDHLAATAGILLTGIPAAGDG